MSNKASEIGILKARGLGKRDRTVHITPYPKCREVARSKRRPSVRAGQRHLSARHVQIGFAGVLVCVSLGMVANALLSD
jgi:hypothetical protein